MKSKFFIILAQVVLFLGIHSSAVMAHCEIPCGIYNDELRVKLIMEHATTIEKSMNQIVQLSGETPINYNQLVRWVTNKEDHANKVQDIVSQYFMTQRIKPEQEKYTEKVTLLHQMLVTAMKCKQTTELSNVEKLRELTDKFSELYFDAAAKEHMKEHKH